MKWAGVHVSSDVRQCDRRIGVSLNERACLADLVHTKP
jgi:hypothetical protein